MASYVPCNKDQNILQIATVNGLQLGACATRDWDIYSLPNGYKIAGWQACIIACGSASLSNVAFKILGGFDGTNFMSFASLSISDTLKSGSQNMFWYPPSATPPFKFIKLSLGSVSYGTGVDSLQSCNVHVFIKPVNFDLI
jgi:hypothetical protein